MLIAVKQPSELSKGEWKEILQSTTGFEHFDEKELVVKDHEDGMIVCRHTPTGYYVRAIGWELKVVRFDGIDVSYNPIKLTNMLHLLGILKQN